MTQAIDRNDIILQLHELGAIQFGDYTLASGQHSPIYIDLRRIIARPTLLKQVALAYSDLVDPLTFAHLAAVPYGALAIGTALSLAMNRPLIFPRKEPKAYGTTRQIEGLFAAGDRAVIIEDLVTEGGSALKAIDVLEAAGLRIRDVVVLLDRGQGGRQTLAEAGYQLHAYFQLSEVLDVLHRQGRITDTVLTTVNNYLA